MENMNRNYTAMTDADLLLLIQGKDSDNQALDTMYSRYASRIEKVTKYICHKVHFDRSLTYEGIEYDALTEAYLVAHDVIMNHDDFRSSFMTDFRNHLEWHFKDLSRKNYKKESRETSYFTFCESSSSETEEDFASSLYEKKMEVERANLIFERSQYQDHIEEAMNKVRQKYAPNSIEARTLTAVKNAMANEEKKPFDAAANELGCSRQTVYNRLAGIKEQIPETLRKEIRSNFMN